MEQQILTNFYEIEFNKTAFADFNNSLKTDEKSSDNLLHQILISVTNIYQKDFESVSQLSSQVSKVISDMHELNYNLMFNDPVKNHIPVLTAIVKSIMYYHMGNLSLEVQKNDRSASQLYGLAFNQMLHGKTILSFLDVNSKLFDTFELLILNKFMDSYAEMVGVSKSHSIIALKHHLMNESDKIDDSYTSDLLTSMGHGFYNLLSNLNDISPHSNWMPFTISYFVQKCVEVHESALKLDMKNGDNYQHSGQYYLQASALLLDEQQVCNKNIFQNFFDYGLYEFANIATKRLKKESSDRWKKIHDLSDQKGCGKHINEFDENYDPFIKDIEKNGEIFSGCSCLLSNIASDNTQNDEQIKDHPFIHNIFNDYLKTKPNKKTGADKVLMLKILIDGISSSYSFEEESILVDVLAGIKQNNKLGTTEEDINKAFDNAKKLNSMGLNLFESNEEENTPDYKLLSVFKNYYFDTLKKTLNLRVSQHQFLLELSKVLDLKYNRRGLIIYEGIRNLIAINNTEELIDTVFDKVNNYAPITVILRFEILESISKTIHQLSPYEGSNITVDILISKLKIFESNHIVFVARDEAYMYEFSKSSQTLKTFISEVIPNATSGDMKPITEYAGYTFIDSNYGWDNLIEKANSFNKAAKIHNRASIILKENGNEKMAADAQGTSRRCEGKAHLLAAFFYESKKNMAQKADDMYTKSIAAFMDGDNADAVKGITARKFWLRERNNSHEEIH